MASNFANKENAYADAWTAGRIPTNIWRYIPQKYNAAVVDAFSDSDGYWIFLDHECGGWVAYDGGEDCGTIHEYTIADLRAAIKTIRKGE